MRWPIVVRLYRRRLRARLGQELFAFVGIAVGVALLFAVQVSNASLGSSITQLTSGLVGRAQLQLLSRDPRGFPEPLVGAVEASPDVEAVAPVVEAPANLVGPDGERAVTLLAADARVTRLGGTLLSGLSLGALPQLRAVILPAGVARAVGARSDRPMRLQIAGHTIPVPVAATLERRAVGTLADAPVVLAPLAFGQTLAETPGRVSRLFVRAKPGRERAVRGLLTRLAGDGIDVRPADFDARVFAQAAQPNDQSTTLFSQVTALVGFLFAFNAMLLMARERRRSIAELRIAGHSAKTVRRVLLLDAFVLGVVASLAGLLLGDQLSRHLLQPAPGYLRFAFPIGTARTVDLGTLVTAFAAGVLATLLGTLVPLLRGRADPIGDDSLDPDAGRWLLRPSWRLLGAGVVVLAASAIVYLAAPSAATVGIGLLVVAMVLCLPVALALALAGVQRLTRRTTSPVAALAIGELRANGIRSVTLASIAAVAVCASGAVEGAHHDLQAGLERSVHGVSATTDVWLSPTSDANQLGVARFRPGARRTIAALPHVEQVDAYRGALLNIGERRVWAYGAPRDSRELVPSSEVLDGDPARANERLRQGNWMTVSRALADEHDLHVGDAFTLPTPNPTRFRVAAITTNLGWSPGAIALNADAFATAWDTTDVTALQVRFDQGTTPAAGRRLVAAALAHGPWSGLTVETALARERHQLQAGRDGLVRLTQIARLVLVTAALAVAIAITAMIWQRRPGLATFKLNGIRRTHLYQALMLETGLLLTIGCATGALFALFGVQLLDRWLIALTGFPVEHSIGATAALRSLAAVTAVALVVTAIPGHRAAGVRSDMAFEA